MSTLSVNIITDSAGTGAPTFTKQLKADFYLTPLILDENYTVPSNFNAISAGPVEVANGVTIEVSNGSTWSVV